jgi:hypothetical protein
MQTGCRSKRTYAEDALSAVRSKNVLAAVFSYVAAARFDEAVDVAIKELDGVYQGAVLAHVVACCVKLHISCCAWTGIRVSHSATYGAGVGSVSMLRDCQIPWFCRGTLAVCPVCAHLRHSSGHTIFRVMR